jgi:hypothetical protein
MTWQASTSISPAKSSMCASPLMRTLTQVAVLVVAAVAMAAAKDAIDVIFLKPLIL